MEEFSPNPNRNGKKFEDRLAYQDQLEGGIEPYAVEYGVDKQRMDGLMSSKSARVKLAKEIEEGNRLQIDDVVRPFNQNSVEMEVDPSRIEGEVFSKQTEEKVNNLGVRKNYFYERAAQEFVQISDKNLFEFTQSHQDEINDLREKYLYKQDAFMRELTIMKETRNVEGLNKIRGQMEKAKADLAKEYNKLFDKYMAKNGIDQRSPYHFDNANKTEVLNNFALHVLMNFEEREKGWFEKNFPNAHRFFTKGVYENVKGEGEKFEQYFLKNEHQASLERYDILEQQFNNPELFGAASPNALLLINRIKADTSIPEDKKLEAFFQLSDTQNVNLGRLAVEKAKYYRPELNTRRYFESITVENLKYKGINFENAIDQDIAKQEEMRRQRERYEQNSDFDKNNVFDTAALVTLLNQLFGQTPQMLNKQMNEALEPTLNNELKHHLEYNNQLDNRKEQELTHKNSLRMSR